MRTVSLRKLAKVAVRLRNCLSLAGLFPSHQPETNAQRSHCRKRRSRERCAVGWQNQNQNACSHLRSRTGMALPRLIAGRERGLVPSIGGRDLVQSEAARCSVRILLREQRRKSDKGSLVLGPKPFSSPPSPSPIWPFVQRPSSCARLLRVSVCDV